MKDAEKRADLVRRLESLTVEQRRRLMEIGSAHFDSGGASSGSAAGLVAFVSMRETQDGPSVDLLSYLKESLPEYMVPSRIIPIEDLPKLPNGKLDRGRLESLVEEEQTDWFAEQVGSSFDPPLTETEEILAKTWSEVLGSNRISRNDHFFEMGGDSILSIQVVSRGRMADLPIEATDLFEYPLLSELARVLEQRTSHPEPRTAHPAARTSHPPRLPLTPIQHWFFNTVRTDRHHWNQVTYVEVDRAIDVDELVDSLYDLPKRHDALRLRFDRLDETWSSRIANLDEATWEVEIVDAAGSSDEDRVVADRIAADQRGFDLTKGPLARCTVFNRGPDEPLLLAMTVHHLLVDQVSVRILLDDLESLIAASERDRESPEIPAVSFADWAVALQSFADSKEIEAELDYWRAPMPAPSSLPWPGVDGEDSRVGTEGDAAGTNTSFPSDVTNALSGEANLAFNTRPDEIILSALWLSLSDLFPELPITIGVEHHGRHPVQGVDPSMIVGWMTAYFPVRFPPAGDLSDGEAIMLVKEKMRAVPNGGVGYGLLRYCRQNDTVATSGGVGLDQLEPEVTFNYLGEYFEGAVGRLRVVRGPQASARSSRCERHCVVEVNAAVNGGRLEINWSYNRIFEDTVRSLAMSVETRLQDLIRRCLASSGTRFTPSDFPDAGLSQDELDRLLDNLG